MKWIRRVLEDLRREAIPAQGHAYAEWLRINWAGRHIREDCFIS